MDSEKSNLELAEIYLLSAIKKEDIDISLLDMAKRKVKNITGLDNAEQTWEETRKDLVRLWFKMNH